MHLGHRWLLNEAIDTTCESFNSSPLSSVEFSKSLLFLCVSLGTRVDIDGCLDDLKVAIEVLRLGINLQISEVDSPIVFHIILAEFLTTRYEILEGD